MPGWGFAVARFLDLVLPGAGVMLDIIQAIEIIEEGISAGDIAQSAGEQLVDQLQQSRRRGETKVSSDRVHTVVRRCEIAVAAELPEGWASAVDPQGRTYYWHKRTLKSQWERPTAETPVE